MLIYYTNNQEALLQERGPYRIFTTEGTFDKSLIEKSMETFPIAVGEILSFGEKPSEDLLEEEHS